MLLLISFKTSMVSLCILKSVISSPLLLRSIFKILALPFSIDIFLLLFSTVDGLVPATLMLLSIVVELVPATFLVLSVDDWLVPATFLLFSIVDRLVPATFVIFFIVDRLVLATLLLLIGISFGISSSVVSV